jgi:hypothetical protein
MTSLVNIRRTVAKTGGPYLRGHVTTSLEASSLVAQLLKFPAWAVVPENLDRPIELLNLQWLFQDRDRADLKNPIEDVAIRVTCDHDNVEAWINLLGCFKYLITGSVRQLQVQKHEIEFLLPKASNGIFGRTDHHSTEADFLQKCLKEILQDQIVVDH